MKKIDDLEKEKKTSKSKKKNVKRPFLPPSLDMCDTTTHMQKMSLFYYICILPYQLFNDQLLC